MNILQKIKNHFWPPVETIPVADPEPKPEPKLKGPDGDGWFTRANGERFRPVKGLAGSGVFFDDDNDSCAGRRRAVRSFNDPFSE